MIFASKCDVGTQRENNEDYYYVPKEGKPDNLFMVADGMGGYNAGEVASQAVVKYVIDELCSKDNINIDAIRLAMKGANRKIVKMAAQESEYEGMGTTLTVALVEDGAAYIAHVGDSRAYLIHGERIIQVTKDHSFVQKLLDEGVINKEQSENHPYKNVITRAIGVNNVLRIDSFETPFDKGDIILLCSDGLYKHIEDDEMRIVLQAGIETGVEKLVELANERGGTDNITAVAVCNCEGR